MRAIPFETFTLVFARGCFVIVRVDLQHLSQAMPGEVDWLRVEWTGTPDPDETRRFLGWFRNVCQSLANQQQKAITLPFATAEGYPTVLYFAPVETTGKAFAAKERRADQCR